MLKKLSGEIVGVLIAVGGTILVHVGFSEACSNEIVQMVPVAVGGITTWIARVRKPDVNVLGVKK